MSEKYIIRNCPSQLTELCLYGICHHCTDCAMKQIVERCREAQKEYPRHFPDGEFDMFVSGRNNLAGNILALLDIQEVE